MTTREYTVLFPFCGLGAGARGFLDAQVTMFGRPAVFRSLGGIDFDPLACQDFEYLTDSPALCSDVAKLTPTELRAFAGNEAPDVVFMSPPCKSFSALLPKRVAGDPKYVAMSRLLINWIEVMLAAWPTPPRLVLLENVPRIASRGQALLKEAKRLLRKAGYLFHAGSHDCGELGGLAQHRTRYLLVARHPRRAAPLLYQPIKKRVRACGEIIGPMPLPGDPAGGPMHGLPKLSWLNWVRLALIPAGGDWRDLEGVLVDGQARREVHRRHRIERWDQPSATIAGSGSNAVGAIADPRLRVRVAYDHGYGVLRFDEPSPTVAGGSDVGQGAYSIADVRFGSRYYNGTYGVISWQDAAGTITGNARVDTGRFAISDPRRPPPSPMVIIAADSTWHRPLTTLELGALQGLPTTWKGRPLTLAGSTSTRWRERIGNAVPPPTARAIAEQMLVCLVAADVGGFSLSSAGSVWVERSERR